MKEIGNKKERDFKVPALKDSNGWLQFCLGLNAPTNQDSMEEPEKESEEITKESMIEKDENNTKSQENELKTQENELKTEENESESIRKRKRDVAFKLGIVLNEENEDDNETYSDDLSEIECNIPVEPLKTTVEWSEHKPTLNLLRQFDQVLTQRVLKFLISYIESDEIIEESEENDENDEEMNENHYTNEENQYKNNNCNIFLLEKSSKNLLNSIVQWIYSLLSRLEKPLHREIESEIRKLYRSSCFLRHFLVEDYKKISINEKKNEEKENFESSLALLNTLITLSGSYFLQNEDMEHYKEIGFNIRRDDDDFENLFDNFTMDDDAESEEEEVVMDAEKIEKIQEYFLKENEVKKDQPLEDGEITEDEEEIEEQSKKKMC